MISIFLIDDNVPVLEFFSEILVRKGYKITGKASSGEEAVQIFREMNPKPDIILLDYRMPGKDGITTARELLALDPWCTIIMVSADASIRDLAIKNNIKGFIHKPCRIDLIEKQIQALAYHRQSHRGPGKIIL